MQIAMLLFPRLTQLDLTGPLEVLSRFPECKIDLVWKTLEPVQDASGLSILPTSDFRGCPQTDILFVPGGPGISAVMEDDEVLAFLREQAGGARYVTSVCTGSLILGAAGLLSGYRATCHWLSLPQLSLLGAEPVAARVVYDRNRVTGAGVTSGIDFALSLAAQIFGEERARKVQLQMEYDPQPPFSGGSPASAPADLVAAVRADTAAFQAAREAVTRRAGARLG